MFNWYSVPAFGAMLLFWLLAAYVLTRGPRNPVTFLAVAAQVSAGAYLLGEAMQANASTLLEWRPWARDLAWGAPVAATVWYWLTVLLLREQRAAEARSYLTWVGYPLGLLFAATTVLLVASLYAGDWYRVWSQPFQAPADPITFSRFHAPPGPLYAAWSRWSSGPWWARAFTCGWAGAIPCARRTAPASLGYC